MAQRTPFAPGGLAERSRPRGQIRPGFWGITAGDARHLRVMIANEPHDRLASWAGTLSDLGHTVIPWDVDAEGVGTTAEPDVALVGLGPARPLALGLVAEIAQTTCPVIAIADVCANAERDGCRTRPSPSSSTRSSVAKRASSPESRNLWS
jgi:hypothetical protein